MWEFFIKYQCIFAIKRNWMVFWKKKSFHPNIKRILAIFIFACATCVNHAWNRIVFIYLVLNKNVNQFFTVAWLGLVWWCAIILNFARVDRCFGFVVFSLFIFLFVSQMRDGNEDCRLKIWKIYIIIKILI